ncbi:MAG: WhiB family transcriptional regulator [Actinomycetota bacterium]|nr:WhiB family transcriptional regulator [Actinomycetota bacterium]
MSELLSPRSRFRSCLPPALDEGRACGAVSDPDAVFFPKQGGSSKAARAVCTCKVRGKCLDYALENHEVWASGVAPRTRSAANSSAS